MKRTGWILGGAAVLAVLGSLFWQRRGQAQAATQEAVPPPPEQVPPVNPEQSSTTAVSPADPGQAAAQQQPCSNRGGFVIAFPWPARRGEQTEMLRDDRVDTAQKARQLAREFHASYVTMHGLPDNPNEPSYGNAVAMQALLDSAGDVCGYLWVSTASAEGQTPEGEPFAAYWTKRAVEEVRESGFDVYIEAADGSLQPME